MYTFSSKLKTFSFILMAVGLLGIGYGFLTAPKDIQEVEKLLAAESHGGHGEGAVAPGLIGPGFKYAKNATNKGMFETIWHGTNGGMGAKGVGLMDPTDPKNGITPDELLKIIAWVRSMGTVTGNE